MQENNVRAFCEAKRTEKKNRRSDNDSSWRKKKKWASLKRRERQFHVTRLKEVISAPLHLICLGKKNKKALQMQALINLFFNLLDEKA